MDGFIAGTLAAVAGALLLYARRRAQTLYLALFLLLVASNFAAIGIGRTLGSEAWSLAALYALALDPLFLLLFVLTSPYDQRDGRVWAVVAVGAAWTLVNLAWRWTPRWASRASAT